MNSDNLQKLQKLNQLTDSMILEISKISQKDKKKIYHNEYASLIYILYFCIQLYNIKHIQKGGINLVPAWDKETNVDTGKKTWVNRWPEKKITVKTGDNTNKQYTLKRSSDDSIGEITTTPSPSQNLAIESKTGDNTNKQYTLKPSSIDNIGEITTTPSPSQYITYGDNTNKQYTLKPAQQQVNQIGNITKTFGITDRAMVENYDDYLPSLDDTDNINELGDLKFDESMSQMLLDIIYKILVFFHKISKGDNLVHREDIEDIKIIISPVTLITHTNRRTRKEESINEQKFIVELKDKHKLEPAKLIVEFNSIKNLDIPTLDNNLSHDEYFNNYFSNLLRYITGGKQNGGSLNFNYINKLNSSDLMKKKYIKYKEKYIKLKSMLNY